MLNIHTVRSAREKLHVMQKTTIDAGCNDKYSLHWNGLMRAVLLFVKHMPPWGQAAFTDHGGIRHFYSRHILELYAHPTCHILAFLIINLKCMFAHNIIIKHIIISLLL